MANDKNMDLVEFAEKAKKMGISYGQLQQKETVKLIREGKIDQNKWKKKWNKKLNKKK